MPIELCVLLDCWILATPMRKRLGSKTLDTKSLTSLRQTIARPRDCTAAIISTAVQSRGFAFQLTAHWNAPLRSRWCMASRRRGNERTFLSRGSCSDRAASLPPQRCTRRRDCYNAFRQRNTLAAIAHRCVLISGSAPRIDQKLSIFFTEEIVYVSLNCQAIWSSPPVHETFIVVLVCSNAHQSTQQVFIKSIFADRLDVTPALICDQNNICLRGSVPCNMIDNVIILTISSLIDKTKQYLQFIWIAGLTKPPLATRMFASEIIA